MTGGVMRFSLNQGMVEKVRLALPYATCINHREFVQLAISRLLYEIENQNGPSEHYGDKIMPEYEKVIIKCRAN